MGSGSWSTNTHSARSSAKLAAGKDIFDYSSTTRRTTPRHSWKAHETLDPKATNKNGPHEGTNVREAADNDEHPESVAISIMFDMTGSMGHLPQVLQKKLPELHALIVRKGYIEHPQILFGAIGDAYSDVVPLQVGQFESDNRMDENLENILLEGGGGGGNHESYELAAYMMARNTALDCLDKRGKKGYMFIIGDERIYKKVRKDQVNEIIGDSLQEDIPTEDIFGELKEKFEVFYLFATQGSYRPETVLPEEAGDDMAHGWRELLGQNALILDDAGAVCETIALTLGIMEGAVTHEDGMEDLKEVSTDLGAIEAAGKALATVGAGAVATAEASDDLPGLDDDDSTDSGAERV